MANSLRDKIKKLEHDGNIDKETCDVLIEKLDDHDRVLKGKILDDVYNVVTNTLLEEETDLDFNLKLQNRILDLKYTEGDG